MAAKISAGKSHAFLFITGFLSGLRRSAIIGRRGLIRYPFRRAACEGLFLAESALLFYDWTILSNVCSENAGRPAMANEYEQQRRKKADALRAAGHDPFG
ncbi:MAG: hypothetical protein WBE00_00630, partial [Phycisphaerae bacterium]